MSEKKRRWFQIHLSTAIVLMIVAGGLMWANLCPKPFRVEMVDGDKYDLVLVGWPTDMAYKWQLINSTYSNYSNPLDATWQSHIDSFAINLAIALAILATVALVCEWRIHRQTHKSASESACIALKPR